MCYVNVNMCVNCKFYIYIYDFITHLGYFDVFRWDLGCLRRLRLLLYKLTRGCDVCLVTACSRWITALRYVSVDSVTKFRSVRVLSLCSVHVCTDGLSETAEHRCTDRKATRQRPKHYANYR